MVFLNMFDPDMSEEHNYRWWPLILFSVIVIGVFIFLFIGGGKNIELPLSPSTGCVVMQDRGKYNDSINIVFLGTGYEDVVEFRADSEKFMSSFLNVAPHNLYRDRFNFFRIEAFDDFGCSYDDAIICNPQLVQQEAIKCPGQDVNVVLTNRGKTEDFFSHLRSSAWLNLASINSADDPLVLVHEIGHIGYNFADEYVYGGDITWDAPNCDPEKLSCPMFSDVDGSECIVGCVNQEYARSVYYGIMSNYWKSPKFGNYDEWWIENYLLENTKGGGEHEFGGDPNEGPTDVYVVKGECTTDGECTIEEVVMSPSRYTTSSKLINSDIEIKHGDSVIKVPRSGLLFKDFGDSGSVELRPYDFLIAIPVDPDENEIVLLDKGNVKSRYIIEKDDLQLGGSKIVGIPRVS